jgi:NAD-dependent deacetylase
MDDRIDPSLLGQAAESLAAAGRVAVLTGAGVSAESGVPTFRGAGGLCKNFRAEDVATPEAFARDAALVWEFYNYRRNLLLDVQPNPAHHALVELESLSDEFTLITQNVDRLHQRAGSRRVLEVHGNLWVVRCTRCGREFDKGAQRLPELPRCDDCGGLVRPAVVWFGESLPVEVWTEAERCVQQCQCLLVVGTSAQVHPAAGLAWLARRAGAAVIEINLEPTPAREIATLGLYGPAGTMLPQLVERWKRLRGKPAS